MNKFLYYSKYVVISCIILVISLTVKGQIISSDCSNAKSLTINLNSTLNTVSGNPGSPSLINCSSNAIVKEGWFYFTATTAYSVVTFQNIGTANGYVYIYSGSCDALTYVKCMKTDSSDVQLMNFRTGVGQKYYVRLVQTDAGGILSGRVGVFANSGTAATLCKPDKLAFATGTADTKGIKTDGDFQAGIAGEVFQDNLIDGYVKFNTSVMPQYKTNTKDIYFNFVNKSSITSFGMTRMIMTKMKNDALDPSTAAASDIYQQLKGTTNAFYNYTSNYIAGNSYAYKLLPFAVTNFDSRYKQGWWGVLIGLDYNTLFDYGDGYAFYGWKTKNFPYIVVTYTVGNYSETGIVCGASVQLDAQTECGSSDENTYKWEPSEGLSSSTIQNPIASPIVTTTYKVTVSNSTCNSIDSVKIVVNPLTVKGTDVSLNCGASTAMATTTNYTGTDVLVYSWTPVEGLDDAHSASPHVTGVGNKSYTVELKTANGCTATDNVYVTVNTINLKQDICIVGVDDSNKNKIIWNKPISDAIDSFIVYRESNVTNVYTKAGGNAYNDYSVFIDELSKPDIQSNKYRISIKDMCGNETVQSAFHKTIHLSINQGMGTTWNLIWEPYAGFTVSTYNIYRGTTQNDMQLIGSVSGANSQYSDIYAPTGFVYYQIEAINPTPCTPSKSDNSSTRSNIVKNTSISINDISNIVDIDIMPNPAKDQIEVVYPLYNKNNVVNLELLSIDGRLVETFVLSDNSTMINVTGLNAGIYILKLSNGINHIVKKFVKL